MGLIAGVLEVRGLATVCLSCFEPITSKVRPPRWLVLDYPLGYPLGAPANPGLQTDILLATLALLEAPGPPSIRREYVE